MFQSTLNFQCCYQTSSISRAFFLNEETETENLNFFLTSSTRQEVLFLPQLMQRKQQLQKYSISYTNRYDKRTLLGAHLLISTNLELLPAVFLSQADSVRLSTWLIGFFQYYFLCFGGKKVLMASILTLASQCLNCSSCILPTYKHKAGHHQFLCTQIFWNIQLLRLPGIPGAS